jgi:hypothetical protein
MNGGGVDLSAAVADSNVDAIVWMGYPGPFGGQAMAETLFGVNVPAGRTITTWPTADYPNQISLFGASAGGGGGG